MTGQTQTLRAVTRDKQNLPPKTELQKQALALSEALDNLDIVRSIQRSRYLERDPGGNTAEVLKLMIYLQEGDPLRIIIAEFNHANPPFLSSSLSYRTVTANCHWSGSFPNAVTVWSELRRALKEKAQERVNAANKTERIIGATVGMLEIS